MKLTSRVKLTLLVIGSAILVLGFIWIIAIATPMRYRVGFWQRLPLLDHRLLRTLIGVLRCSIWCMFRIAFAFYLGRVQQRSDRREKRHAALIAHAIRLDVPMGHHRSDTCPAP